MPSSIARCIFQRNGRRSRSSGSHIRACRHGLCDQTKARDENDRPRDSRGCAIQVGRCRYGLTVSETSNSNSARQAKAMCSGSIALTCSDPGASGDQSLAPPRKSRRRGVHPTGNACRQGKAPKGPRLHDWCYLELADLDAGQFNKANEGLWTRGLLIRRRIADGDLAFFTTWCQQEHPSKRWSRRRPSLGDRGQF